MDVEMGCKGTKARQHVRCMADDHLRRTHGRKWSMVPPRDPKWWQSYCVVLVWLVNRVDDHQRPSPSVEIRRLEQGLSDFFKNLWLYQGIILDSDTPDLKLKHHHCNCAGARHLTMERKRGRYEAELLVESQLIITITHRIITNNQESTTVTSKNGISQRQPAIVGFLRNGVMPPIIWHKNQSNHNMITREIIENQP